MSRPFHAALGLAAGVALIAVTVPAAAAPAKAGVKSATVVKHRAAVRRMAARVVRPVAVAPRSRITTRASLMPSAHPLMLVNGRMVRAGTPAARVAERSAPVAAQPQTPVTSLTSTVPTIEGRPGKGAGAVGVDPSTSSVGLTPNTVVTAPPTPTQPTVTQQDGTITTGAAPVPPR